MTDGIRVLPVRKSVTVRASPARAFEVFTAGMVRWWDKRHSINPSRSPIREIVLEPRAGGRWYERGQDGSECEWGGVLAWEPPSRLLLAWRITPEWGYDPDLITEVEVRFVCEGAGTRVELEHRLDGYGSAAAAMFAIFDRPDGWQGSLEAFARLLA